MAKPIAAIFVFFSLHISHKKHTWISSDLSGISGFCSVHETEQALLADK